MGWDKDGGGGEHSALKQTFRILRKENIVSFAALKFGRQRTTRNNQYVLLWSFLMVGNTYYN